MTASLCLRGPSEGALCSNSLTAQLSRLSWVPLLTVLPVVVDLHFALFGPGHGLGNLADGFFVGQLSMKEVAGAGLLHDVRSGEAGHLTEAVVAVDDCTVFHSSIGYDKFAI